METVPSMANGAAAPDLTEPLLSRKGSAGKGGGFGEGKGKAPGGGFSKGDGKGWKAAGKAKAKAKAKQKGKPALGNPRKLLLQGDVVTFSRFDDPEDMVRAGPFIVLYPGEKNPNIADEYKKFPTLRSTAMPSQILRMFKDGRVDLQGALHGPRARIMVVGGESMGDGIVEKDGVQTGEIGIYFENSHLWLTIEPDGKLGCSSVRRTLRCRWLQRPKLKAGKSAVAIDAGKANAEADELKGIPEDKGEGEAVPAAPSSTSPVETVEPTSEIEEPVSNEIDEIKRAEEEAAVQTEEQSLKEQPQLPQDYWKQQLREIPVLELKYPPLHPMDVYLSDDVHLQERRVECDFGDATESHVLAVWAALLCRYGRADDIAIAVETTPSGRFVPLRVPASDEWTLQQLADLCQSNLQTATDYSSMLRPFLAEGSITQMSFQVGFVFGASTCLSGTVDRLALERQMRVTCLGAPEHLSSRLELQLRCAPTGANGAMVLQLLHKVGVMDDAIATRALAHLEALLFSEGPCAVVETCDENERALLLSWSDASSEEYAPCATQCIHEAFEACAVTKPDTLALIDEERQLTYAQLAVAAAALAEKLLAAGVTPDSLVPLMSDRSLEMIIGIFGILRAEAGYVPLDTKWPDDRVLDVAEQCAPKAACAGPGYEQRLASILSTTSVLEIAKCAAPMDRVAAAAAVTRSTGRSLGGDGAVYCFFTSGSTGKPKGVVVEHKGLVHRIRWFQNYWGMKPGERGILKHSYTFGLSEWEIFWPLSFECTMVLCKPGGEKDMEYLWRLTEMHKVRTQVFVPSVLRAALEYAELELEDRAGRLWPKLTGAITCGEPLTAKLAYQFADLIPHATLDNLYGPTEGEMTVWRAPKGEIFSLIPIGVPMAGSRVLLRTAGGGLASIGEPGEICFGGDFIARGYLGLPALTAEKFVRDDYEGSGGRLYTTGDLARWRESGILDFLGRADFQVKLRGFRIELGEIEEVIRAAGAKSVVCVVVGEAPSQRLVAYAAPDNLDAEALRRSCAGKLPAYMVPAQVVILDALPRTASGKVDRKSLPPPPEATISNDEGDGPSAIVPPKNELERKIRDVWAEVLSKDAESISVEGDWLLIGGNSLLAGKATSMLRKGLDVQLPGTAMYTHSTIARLGELAAKLGADTSGSPTRTAGGARKDTGPKPAEERYGAMDPRRPAALLIQFLIAVVGNMVGDSGSLALRVAIAWQVYNRYGFLGLVVSLPIILVMALLSEALLCIVLKHVFVGKLQPGRYPLWGSVYFRWLLNRHIVEKIRDRVSEMVASTCLLSVFYRALGTSVGSRVELSDPELEETDLVSIGDDVEVHHARLSTSAIMDGELVLGRIDIGDKCRLLPRCMVVHGTKLAEGSQVPPLSSTAGWMGSVGAVCPLEYSDIDKVATQDNLRIFVGLPLLLLLHCCPAVPVIWVLERLWSSTASSRWIFWLLAPVIWRHGYALGFFAYTVLQKRLFVGKILPGPKIAENSPAWQWDSFRIWLHEQAVCAKAFDDAMDPFVGGEILSMMYRMLGTKVGRRVQIDNFHVAEHDCVTIEDDVVFGSVVSIFCNGTQGRLPVRLHRGANLLDHGVVMAGARIGERAVLGSASLAPEGSYFPPESVSTGNVGGRPVRLRFQASNESTAEAEKEAMRRLNSNLWFWGFNTGLALAAIVCSPIPLYELLATYAVWTRLVTCLYSLLGPSFGMIVGMCLLPIVFFFVRLVTLLLNYVIKWCVIGRYKEGDYAFFGAYHISWMVMLILAGVLEDVMDALQGTEYLMWYYRAMGANVGKNCALFGLAFEYDLLTVGDNSSIGWECDTTCHTVENMVIKLAPTVLESYTSMLPHSMVSPGAALSKGAVVLENSQVLKGEQVPANEMWAGLPASSCGWVKEPGSEAVPEVSPPVMDTIMEESVETDNPSVSALIVEQAPAEPNVKPAMEPLKGGLAAFEESAVVEFPDMPGVPKFLVESLWNGNFCLWAIADDMSSLKNHLRIRKNLRVDYEGMRGIWAQFTLAAPWPAAADESFVELRNVGTGRWLDKPDKQSVMPTSQGVPVAVRARQVYPPRGVSTSKSAQRIRNHEEARLYVLERRQEAAFAIQSAEAAD